MYGPYSPDELEYDVSVSADIEVTCRNCDEDFEIEGADLEGTNYGLGYRWTCEKCGTVNDEEYDTDKFFD